MGKKETKQPLLYEINAVDELDALKEHVEKMWENAEFHRLMVYLADLMTLSQKIARGVMADLGILIATVVVITGESSFLNQLADPLIVAPYVIAGLSAGDLLRRLFGKQSSDEKNELQVISSQLRQLGFDLPIGIDKKFDYLFKLLSIVRAKKAQEVAESNTARNVRITEDGEMMVITDNTTKEFKSHAQTGLDQH